MSKKATLKEEGKKTPRTLMKRGRGESDEFKTKELARTTKVFYIVIRRCGGRRGFFFFTLSVSFCIFLSSVQTSLNILSSSNIILKHTWWKREIKSLCTNIVRWNWLNTKQKILWLFLKTVVTMQTYHCNDYSRAHASMGISLHHCLWLKYHWKTSQQVWGGPLMQFIQGQTAS